MKLRESLEPIDGVTVYEATLAAKRGLTDRLSTFSVTAALTGKPELASKQAFAVTKRGKPFTKMT